MDSPTQYSGGSVSSGSGGSEVMLASSNPKKRAGRKKFKETRHPVYRGIRRKNNEKNDKWVCELREPTQQKRVWLGTYPTAEMAARAHDVAALAFRGKSACLNFADSATCGLPVPDSMEARDIRKAATQAAQMCRIRDAQTALDADWTRQENIEAEAHEASASSTKAEDLNAWSENMFSMDDEDLPGLLHDMANGMLIDPPHFGKYTSTDDIGNDGDISLWDF